MSYWQEKWYMWRSLVLIFFVPYWMWLFHNPVTNCKSNEAIFKLNCFSFSKICLGLIVLFTLKTIKHQCYWCILVKKFSLVWFWIKTMQTGKTEAECFSSWIYFYEIWECKYTCLASPRKDILTRKHLQYLPIKFDNAWENLMELGNFLGAPKNGIFVGEKDKVFVFKDHSLESLVKQVKFENSLRFHVTPVSHTVMAFKLETVKLRRMGWVLKYNAALSLYFLLTLQLLLLFDT